VNTAERSEMMVARVYPALDLTTVARPYVLLQITIWQQVLGYNDEVGFFAMRLAVSKSRCLEGSSTPAYKGAWCGHHGGTGADTIWSPRLSPIQCRALQGNPPWACLWICHKLLGPIPPWAFQQLGRPVGNPPYHLHGPPWHAGLGLRRWCTHLVYPQQ
jgi:hypothetical protein